MPNPSRRDYHFFLFLALSLAVHAGVMAMVTWWPPRNAVRSLESEPLLIDLSRVASLAEILPPVPETQPRPVPLPPKHSDVHAIGEDAGKDEISRSSLGPLVSTLSPTPGMTTGKTGDSDNERTTSPLTASNDMGNVPVPLPAPQGRNEGAPPLPSRFQLRAAADSAAQNVADEWQDRMRAKLEEEGKLRFDRANGILGSFYLRFEEALQLSWSNRSLTSGHSGIGMVVLKVNRAGLVENLDFVHSTGYADLDKEFEEAVLATQSRLGYLPSAWPYDSVTFVLTFWTYPSNLIIK